MGSRIATSSSSAAAAAATFNKASPSSSHPLRRRRSSANGGARKKRVCFDTNAAQIFVSFVIILAIFSWFGGGGDVASATTLLRKQPSSSNEPVFSLLVTLVFENPIYKDRFLQDIQPVVDHVTRNEQDTLGYKILQSNQNPLQVMIIERYKNKDMAYLVVHKSSKPFLEFRPKLQQMQDNGHVTISGHSYFDSNIGFINE